MESRLKGEIEKIRRLCETLNLSKRRLPDEFLFTVVGMNYFFFNENIGPKDIQDGFVDGKGDGGVDFIHTDDTNMYLVQGKTGSKVSVEDLHNIFNKMLNTINKMASKNYGALNRDLCRSYLSALDTLPDPPNITMVLFSKAKIDEKTEKVFRREIEKIPLSAYDIEIYDREDLQNKMLEVKLEDAFVSEGSLLIDTANNVLEFGENGIIVNIKASSLKDLYKKYQGKGLFNYNLREHFREKSVDDGIDRTIEKDPSKFWFYNNGVTIACESFFIDGYKIKLRKFSIINGAQTTTKIGKSLAINGENDFELVCKIVQTGEMSKSTEFINNISEASNSQKPIKFSDLKSNSPEQKWLAARSAENKPRDLAISIKRGVKPSNFNQVYKDYKVSNEYIGQLILSIILQRPGTARSNKKAIFAHPPTYNEVFKRKMDYDTLYDMVRLSRLYDEYKINMIKSTPKDDPDNIVYKDVAKNGKFVVLAIIGYMIKRKRGIVDNCLDENLRKDNLSETLISYQKDDFEDKLNELFEVILDTLKMVYMSKSAELESTSASNFFKTDLRYQSIILQGIDRQLYERKTWAKNVIELLSVVDS